MASDEAEVLREDLLRTLRRERRAQARDERRRAIGQRGDVLRPGPGGDHVVSAATVSGEGDGQVASGGTEEGSLSGLEAGDLRRRLSRGPPRLSGPSLGAPILRHSRGPGPSTGESSRGRIAAVSRMFRHHGVGLPAAEVSRSVREVSPSPEAEVDNIPLGGTAATDALIRWTRGPATPEDSAGSSGGARPRVTRGAGRGRASAGAGGVAGVVGGAPGGGGSPDLRFRGRLLRRGHSPSPGGSPVRQRFKSSHRRGLKARAGTIDTINI